MATLHAGIAATQGNMSEHADVVKRAAEVHGVDVEIVEIRSDDLVPDCDVLLMLSGESITISRLLEHKGIVDEIHARIETERSTLATCIGLIAAPRDARDDRVTTFDLLDAAVDRNAFGQQVDSFEAPLDVAGLDLLFPAVFIRTPLIDEVDEDIEVLAERNDDLVAVRDGPAVGASFHPELTPDSRLRGLAFFDELAVEIDA